VQAIPSSAALTGVEERVIAPTQVDVSTAGAAIVTPGRVVGIPANARIDRVAVQRGRGLGPEDVAASVAMVDASFARFYALPDTGVITLAGGHRLRFVGHGLSPEYFVVTTEVGFLGTEANFAVVYLPLATAQTVTGQPGPVNDVVLRPLLLGVQIAVLGVALGLPFGLLVGNAFLGVLKGALPLPEYRSAFQGTIFLRGALLGIVLPIIATAYPTLRSVMMPPIRAVQAGFRTARGSPLSRLARRLTLPGRTIARMPVRNLVRAPRRTLFTVLGIAAAVTTVVGVTGMVDSFGATIDRSTAALAGESPDRVQVTLRDFVAQHDPAVTQVSATAGVERAEPAITSGATLIAQDEQIDVVLEVIDAGSAIWRPALSRGSSDPERPAW
jgi:hypothetical protein